MIGGEIGHAETYVVAPRGWYQNTSTLPSQAAGNQDNAYASVDVLDSVSRLMLDVITPEHRAAAGKIKELLAVYRDAEDLINIGAYIKGSSAKIDHAIANIDRINQFLRQDIHERVDPEAAITELIGLIDAAPTPVSEMTHAKV